MTEKPSKSAGIDYAPDLQKVRLPSSPGQEGIWFAQKLLGDSPAFNVCHATRLVGPLDRTRLHDAVDCLTRRHESLRTAVIDEGGRPVLQIDQNASADFAELAFPVGDPARDKDLRALLQRIAAEPVDLAGPTLLRVRLLTDGNRDHVLVIICHHIVFDGWSARLLMEDLSRLYGSPAFRADPPPPYSEYVGGVLASGEPGTEDAAMRFWTTKLAGHVLPQLPLDNARTGGPATDGRLFRFDVPKDTGSALRALSARLACTPYMALLAVYCLAVRDVCVTDDVGIATPLSGRADRRFSGTIGLFANLAILRTQIAGDMTFGEIARRVRGNVLEALKHQTLPYDRILRDSDSMRRDISEAPFSVGFSMLDDNDTSLNLNGLAAQRIPLVSGATRCDLWLTLIEHDGSLSGEVEYDGRLINDATIHSFAQYFTQWIAAVCADPATPVDAIRIQAGHGQYRSPPANPPLPTNDAIRRFLGQAASTPDAVAIQWRDSRLSYREVETLSGRLAAKLAGLGIAPGQPVALRMERSPSMVIAFLAILRSRGAYFPIDPAHPLHRRDYMLQDSGAKVLIVDQDDTGESSRPELTVIRLADLGDFDSLPIAIAPRIEVDPDSVAYLLYTSGSSGEPKGVLSLHGGLTNHIHWLIDTLAMGPHDRMLFKTSIGFDPSVQEMLAPLCCGGTVVVAEPGGQQDIPYLVREIRESGVTMVQLVPSALRLLLADQDAASMTTLRYLICGGEPLHKDLAARARDTLPAARLGNFYGPTEASCDVTFCAYDGSTDASGQLPIGNAISNVYTRVMPASGAPRELPVGAIGELHIGGAGVARGYLNRPDLTAARFVADPFDPTSRLYRSGDLVRRRGDGQLEFVGRTDAQIKLRGHRIDPGEIETVVREIPQVEDCVVAVVSDPQAGGQLVAFYSGAEVALADFMRVLRARLPAHMVPNAFRHVPGFPLLPGGKIDRAAVASNGQLAGQSVRPTSTAPRSPLEESLWAVWRDVLPRSQYGVHDNFFELGGHSLLATQVLSRIRGTLGVNLTIRDFIGHPTVAELAGLVAKARKPESASVEPPITPQARRPGEAIEFPVSFSQRRMWFVQAYDPGTTSYNMPFSIRLSGLLDIQSLDAAFRAVTLRHEAFRTTFPVRDGEPVQLISPNALPFPIVLRSFEGLPDASDRVTEWFRDETLKPFDLSRGPLHRVLIARISPTDHAMLWLVHHVIGDQWSAGLLYNELLTLYQANVAGTAVVLPPLSIQYADFAVWQRGRLTDQFLAPQLSYWREKLRGIAPLNFPVSPATTSGTSSGAVVFGMFPADLLAQLRNFGISRGATPYMTLLAAFNILLSRFTGQADIAVGSPIANRHHEQSELVVGTLVNTLVMRTDLSENPTFAELLDRVKHVALDAYANQDVPFERLVEEHGAASAGARVPLIQVLFNVVNAIGATPDVPSLRLLPFEFDPGSSQFDITLSVNTEPDSDAAGWIGVSYSTSKFDAETMRRFLERFVLLVSQAIAEPEKPISRLGILLPDERRTFAEWNATWVDYPEHLRVDQLFSMQASRTPDGIAVEGSGTFFTYRELDALASRIAAYLATKGAGPGKLVGIHLDRTPSMLAALLAVMRTGAAYVPLDPAFPLERLQFMVADAQISILLSHSWLQARTKFDVDCIDLDLIDAQGESHHAPGPAESIDGLAYVLYTSGSTGKPKGVEVSHRSLTNFLWSMRREPGFQPADRILAITTLSFDISGLELFLPLICGGTVVMASSEEARDGRLLRQCFDRSGPSVMQATPSTWRMLISTEWMGHPDLRILCGGESLSPDLARALLERCGELWNVYGPTETTIWSTVARISDPDDLHIGKPIANTTVCVLGPFMEPLPPGWPGELCIGGHGLSRGYHGRADLTAQRFVESPLAGITGERIYRTGDLARQLPDGRLVHLGRSDFQVKIRGYRIELGEIEEAIAATVSPAQVVVTARDDAAGNKQLVAYVVPHQQQQIDASELRQSLRRTLPDYMIPAYVMSMPSLPLTANRKVDVGALPSPSPETGALARTCVPPRGRLEVQLTALWRQVLNDDTIGVEDNFFERGGHSLLAVQLASQIELVTGVQIPLATLFQAPSVSAMAKLLSDSQWRPSWRSLVAIQAHGRSPPLFLVPGVGGNVLMFAALARRLGNNQPVYGLQARGLDEAEPPMTSIVRIARSHISEMRTVIDHGPWFIAGACTGGVIAFEIARQLRLAGEPVHLILLDTWHPASAVRTLRHAQQPNRLLKLAGAAFRFARAMLFTSPGRAWRLFRRALRSDWHAAEWTAERARHSHIALSTSKVAAATWRAVSRYRPPALRGDLFHIIASRRHVPQGVADTRRMWLSLAQGQGTSAEVPATDSGQLFVSPHVDATADLIHQYLKRPLPPAPPPAVAPRKR